MAGHGGHVKNIWMLSREYGELAGAGGVKDVVCQLAETLARWTGRSLHVVLPLYGFMNIEELGLQPLEDPICTERILQLQIGMDHPDQEILEDVRYFYKKNNRVNLYLIDAERYRLKSDVYTYTEKDELLEPWQKRSTGHYDYFAMNLLLQKAALELMIALGEKPDIIHCHDAHTAILPGLIREHDGYRSYFRGTGCLVTVHNAGYGYHQEVADISYAESITSLPLRVIHNSQLDDKFDPFLVAGEYALVNTVSENYARELQESDSDSMTGWLGHELLRRRVVLEGITNGIEPALFSSLSVAGDNPELLFDPGDCDDSLPGKKLCKQALTGCLDASFAAQGLEVFGKIENDVTKPLFVFIGRLSEQKGVDILIEVLPVLLEKEDRVQIVILGNGLDDIESRLIQLTKLDHLQGRMCFLKGYNPEVASRVYAGGDFLIIPSRYEPCGLTDFIAQLFGTIPVVHHVGGLVKVIDDVTGIAYNEDSPEGLLGALNRALTLFDDPVRRREVQLQAVREIEKKYAWSKVMKKYVALYQKARSVQLC